MTMLFCDACGDKVNAAYPIKVTFPHGGTMTFHVCLECYHRGTPLNIDVKRKEQVAEICTKLTANKDGWLRRIGKK